MYFSSAVAELLTLIYSVWFTVDTPCGSGAVETTTSEEARSLCVPSNKGFCFQTAEEKGKYFV